ncbi:MAG: hypothetical protein QM692_22655, partial [Thermomicrobiales bacterium]
LAAVAGGVLGALGLGGITPAVRAARGDTCTLAFTATVRSGSNAGKQLVSGAQPGELTGQISFTLSDTGDIENGELTLPNGATAPVVGQATGHSFQIRTPLGSDLVLVAVGVGESAIGDCAGAIDGLITGPARGDMGDFHAEAQGATPGSGGTGGDKTKDKDKKKDRDTTGAAGAAATVTPADGTRGNKDKDKANGNGNGNGSGSGTASQTCPQNQTFCNIGAGYCADLQTDATNCGACGNQCPINNCAKGVCITSDQQTCNPPLLYCNGDCIDPQLDAFNCGACGVACGIGEACQSGTCAPTGETCEPGEVICNGYCANLNTSIINCGACGAACGSPYDICLDGVCTFSCDLGTACGEVCVDTTSDSRNCGGCGVTCPSDQICQNSACIGAGNTGGAQPQSTGACAEGLTDCGGTCVDMMADDLNCSACGARCNLGEHCILGVCTAPCAPGLTLCGDACADLQNDPNNCGTCYTVCPSGQCGIGICVEVVGPSASCQPGYTLCNGACVDLTSDLFNCGSCGYSCNIGKSPTCEGSVCYNGGVCPDDPGGAC